MEDVLETIEEAKRSGELRPRLQGTSCSWPGPAQQSGTC